MNEFNLEEWKRRKKTQELCPHDMFRVALGTMVNGRPIRRFACVVCGFNNIPGIQHDVNDADRVIASKKHAGKKLSEIAQVDLPYVFWVAVSSKLPQADRYACARVCANKLYVVPDDDMVIPKDELYGEYIALARDYIITNGGNI